MQIIIGVGNMARGTATCALSGRHTVRIIDREPDKAAWPSVSLPGPGQAGRWPDRG